MSDSSKNTFILASEPLDGWSTDAVRTWLKENDDEQSLADAFAKVHNKTGWLMDALDDEDDPCPSEVFDDWNTLEHQIGYMIVRRYMPEHGYFDGAGWWVKKQESDNPCRSTNLKIAYKPEFLFAIRKYLGEHGFECDTELDSIIRDRENGRKFDLSDHIGALVHAQLSNRRPWKKIAPHLNEIDAIFDGYQPTAIRGKSPDYYIDALTAIKCGNRCIRAQMGALSYNITVLERIRQEHRSIDTYVESMPSYVIAESLSKYGSPYKLRQVGPALAWEYLRNVGVDGAKPDVHLTRFLGASRLGVSSGEFARPDEVYAVVSQLSKECDLSMAEVDNLIWQYCAKGYAGVCASKPNCSVCVIREYCHWPDRS